MKQLSLIFFLILLGGSIQAQMPTFLLGTWKQEGKPLFEHWDRNQDGNLKGFSYQVLDGGEMLVSEYLDLSVEGKGLIYKATVLNQNQGKGISFEGSLVGDTYTFVNAKHSFPKVISYQKLGSDSMKVTVSGGEKQFSYKMGKVKNAKLGKEIVEHGANNASMGESYDENLAKSLGADDYGMKNYFLVVLKTGENKTTDKEFINTGFRGHMDNMGKLVKDGKLVVAGPFGKNTDQFRGIFILQNLKDMEEAKAVVDTDPAVKAGLLGYSIYPWYGSAALPMYLPYSEKISKAKP